ncbi:MAG: thiamine phosphate synthase [Pseudomonadota bacterium]
MDGLCRLYLITPPQIDDLSVFKVALSEAFDGGSIAAIQLRLKGPDNAPPEKDDVKRIAEVISPIAREANALFLINDDPHVAKEVGADGVHIGQSDVPYDIARSVVGQNGIVGVTCHASMDLAIDAGSAGADYVAFGAFFPTRTKNTSTQAPISIIKNWTFAAAVPCVAIGGITVNNVEPLLGAGADYVAVSSGVWNASAGPKSAVSQFNALFAAHC